MTAYRLRSLARQIASLRPVVGNPSTGPESSIAVYGGRRYRTVGVLTLPFGDLAHQFATSIVDVLQSSRIDVFVVKRQGDAVVIGLDLDERGPALAALVDQLDDGWLLSWSDRRGRGVVRIDRALKHRRVRRARNWILFKPYRWGGEVVGLSQGVVVTFWQQGWSGQNELVGERGDQRFDPGCPATLETIDGRVYPGRTAFRFDTSVDQLSAPVDIVYTWVDGQDPAWLESLKATARDHGRGMDDPELDAARFRSRDELRYSLRSIWAYASWVRRIWIVTAGQVPAWLAEDDRVTIIDHTAILPGDALPTFNSHAIETALHRIEGLAEHFVYFNDDVFLGRSVRPETFFETNGLPRVFRSGAVVSGIERSSTPAFETALLRVEELMSQKVGSIPSFALKHAPFPLRRSIQAEIADVFAGPVGNTARGRFRGVEDVSVASALGPYYAHATGRAVFGDISSEYVNVESGRLSAHLDRIRLGRDLDVFCINATCDNAVDVNSEQVLRRFFERAFPVPAPWERVADGLDG